MFLRSAAWQDSNFFKVMPTYDRSMTFTRQRRYIKPKSSEKVFFERRTRENFDAKISFVILIGTDSIRETETGTKFKQLIGK